MTRKSGFGWMLTGLLLVGIQTAVSAQNQNTAGQSANSTTTTNADNTAKTSVSTGRDLAISAAKSANHTTLFRVLRVSGLTEQAASKGPYTVFAPTNEAFDKLPAGTLDELLKPAARTRLTKVLAYHVVKGRYTTEQLQDGQKLKTITGSTLTVGKQGDSVTITDGAGNTATLNQPEAEATNGIIHSVDTVLMAAPGGK